MIIAEVCERYDITADILRCYERIDLIPRVSRTSGEIWDCDEESYGWIELMERMHKVGVGIEVLIEYVALFKQGDEATDARKGILIRQHERLEERMAGIQRSLDTLNFRIRKYGQELMEKEQLLKEKHNNKNYET